MSAASWLCQKCGHWFVWVRQGKETKPDKCPECGSSEVTSLEG